MAQIYQGKDIKQACAILAVLIFNYTKTAFKMIAVGDNMGLGSHFVIEVSELSNWRDMKTFVDGYLVVTNGLDQLD